MNRMWSVLIIPYLVYTVVPSTSGSRSRCTPWRDTSAPLVSWRVATLSISSMKTMPFCSALASARLFVGEQFHRLGDLELARAALVLPELAEHAAQLLGHFLHALGAHDFQMRAAFGDVDLDVLVVEQAFAQLFAKHLPRRAVGCRLGAVSTPGRRDQHIQDAILGGVLGAG